LSGLPGSDSEYTVELWLAAGNRKGQISLSLWLGWAGFGMVALLLPLPPLAVCEWLLASGNGEDEE
jgi:hypothetical protein